jgi:hypothetical protein
MTTGRGFTGLVRSNVMSLSRVYNIVTFESANPDCFLAHYGVGESTSRFGKSRWIEAATRLTHSNVLSIAVIRGRTRAVGAEFALASDLRFANREKAVGGTLRSSAALEKIAKSRERGLGEAGEFEQSPDRGPVGE